MIFNIIIFNCILCTVGGHQPWRSRSGQARSTVKKCLTGYMTDVQSWVHGDGTLTSAVDNKHAIDLSNKVDAVPLLHQQLTSRMSKGRKSPVRYLSMANCGLSEVPMIFTFNDNVTTLAETVEYVTFYGNSFELTSSTGQEYDVMMNATDARELTPSMVTLRILTVWSIGFIGVTFPKLKELDLRSCSIRALESHVFTGMFNLESLYLGENSINVIDATAFHGLKSLIHLDLSRNFAYDNNDLLMALAIESMDIFQDLVSLQSLDLSYTKLTQRNTPLLRSLSPRMQRLSLCYCSISRLREDAFRHTSLRYLDVSGNLDVLSHPKSLRGLEGTLRVLYAEDTALKSLEPLKNFRKLEILKLTSNEITGMPKHIVDSLRNLLILDLDKNRIISWFERNISLLPKLALLSLRENNINMISDEMAKDIANVSYVGLSKNFIICNCNARDIYELAWRNEMFTIDRTILRNTHVSTDNRTSFHIAFEQYNELVTNRKPLLRVCDGKHICDVSLDLGFDGNLRLFDYTPADYQCLLVTEGPKSTGFENFPTCNQMLRDNNLEDIVRSSWNRLYLIAIPAIILPSLALLFVMRRNLWYFFITMRNSAMLSLINKNENIDDGTIFNYDVFVSYCNEDRAWVLDQLLPHVERDCNISVCLHERDFQVGLSILENIVSCMDRSRSIMLILSKRFLLSQWCQFEMHLAQHRLLETRREDLILILLEEIPRRLRPNTLHYLMLTKTYIVWPKTEGERTHFWKRLKKSLVTHKQKSTENSSLA